MKPVELDHFKLFKMPGALRASGRGELAFLLRQANMEENRYDSDLWLLRGDEPLRLTADGNVAAFWWRDEATLVFTRRQEGGDEKKTVLYALTVDGPGEAAPLLTLDYEVEDLACLDGERFVFVAPSDGKLLPRGAEERDRADYEVVTELPVWENGEGFTGEKRRRLYLWGTDGAKPLVDEWTTVEQLQLSEDKRYAFCVAQSYKGVPPFFNRLLRLDMTSLEVKDVSHSDSVEHMNFVPLDGDGLLAFVNDAKSYGINQNAAFWRLNHKTGESALLYDGGGYGNWSSVGSDVVMGSLPGWHADGDTVTWVTTIDDSSHLMRIDVNTGKITQLTQKAGAAPEFAAGGGRIYFTALRGLYGPEIYTLDGDGETRLTDFNTALLAGYAYSQPEGLFFENRERVRLRGWAIRPPGRREGEKCPAILAIHGGPKTVYGPVLNHEMQYWAALGFGVIFCNPTGGDGRGDTFADLRGRYGEIDYEDLMRFVDVALDAHPWIDADRLGVTGGSYGGFMTNWIIGHTDRFKAAVSQRGISNWTTLSLTSDIGWYFEPDQTGTDPWKSPSTLWDMSPLKYADRAVTPTLFIHSDEDYRCTLPEALQMYTALQIHGVKTRLCLFHGENHELSRSGKPRHRVARLREIAAWFEEHLLPENKKEA